MRKAGCEVLVLRGAFFALLLASAVHAQQTQDQSNRQTPSASESVEIGGLTLRLGMAQDYVIHALSEYYSLQEIGTATATGSSWLAQTKGGPPYAAVANVAFIGGRLSSVYKYWTGVSEPDTEAGFASMLYGAVTRLEQEGKTPCEVTTNSSQQPAGEVKGVFVTCRERQKYLSIDVVPMRNGKEGVSLSEVLKYPADEMAVLKEIAEAGAAGSVAPSSSVSTKTSSAQLANQAASSLEEAQVAVNVGDKARREVVESANPSALVTIRAGERLPAEELARAAVHNRALCDQTITVAGLTPNGLALYVPPLGQKFMAKNSQNYPRMCLVEDSTSFVPGVPRYLLVYAYSQNAFAGFQPVTRTTTVPVSGSGTLMSAYGNQWNFTYTGTMTEMDTIESPYVIQSHSLYLNAYDENGNAVSHHSITVSSQAGGDASYAAGYNGAQLIALLWNNPSRLIKSVLKDVQKNSEKYVKK
jgi:hypothetical protein